jgi:3-oxoacyl-[acyl-carrier protein] reductase
MDLGLSGRRALVCGSSRGLGFACANALVAEGVAVTLVSGSSTALADAAGRSNRPRACVLP